MKPLTLILILVVLGLAAKITARQELSPDQVKIRNYAAEIDNLNYQLNQCRMLVGEK